MHKLPTFAPCALIMVLLYSPIGHAKVCRTKVTLPVPEAGTCSVDSSNDQMSNPFAYVNPLGGCDLTFSLPGMPDFSFEGLNSALCNLVKDYGQDAINEALGPINDLIPDNISLDMEDMMDDMFEDQKDMQEIYCPTYNSSGKLISYRCDNQPAVPDVPDKPDWGVDIDPDGDNNNEGKECITHDGVEYCYSKPKPTPVPDHQNPDLPLCSELDDFVDSDGNLIPCRSDNFDDNYEYSPPPEDLNSWSTNSSKKGWNKNNSKSGW